MDIESMLSGPKKNRVDTKINRRGTCSYGGDDSDILQKVVVSDDVMK